MNKSKKATKNVAAQKHVAIEKVAQDLDVVEHQSTLFCAPAPWTITADGEAQKRVVEEWNGKADEFAGGYLPNGKVLSDEDVISAVDVQAIKALVYGGMRMLEASSAAIGSYRQLIAYIVEKQMSTKDVRIALSSLGFNKVRISEITKLAFTTPEIRLSFLTGDSYQLSLKKARVASAKPETSDTDSGTIGDEERQSTGELLPDPQSTVRASAEFVVATYIDGDDGPTPGDLRMKGSFNILALKRELVNPFRSITEHIPGVGTIEIAIRIL